MRWVIGDIHGMLRLLEALLREVERRDPSPDLFFAGDYVNRGPDARGVIDLLVSLRAGGRARFVRGNHDDVFDLVLHGQSYSVPPNLDAARAFAWFMNHGLANTMAAYGADYAELEFTVHHPSPDRMREVGELVPAAHREFVRALPTTIQEPDLFVAHAQWDPDEPDDARHMAAHLGGSETARHKLLWGRFPAAEVSRLKRWKRTAYFGHTPVSNYPAALRGGAADNVPARGPKIVLLDTGAAMGVQGRLTAVSPDSGEVIQVDRSGAVVGQGE